MHFRAGHNLPSPEKNKSPKGLAAHLSIAINASDANSSVASGRNRLVNDFEQRFPFSYFLGFV